MSRLSRRARRLSLAVAACLAAALTVGTATLAGAADGDTSPSQRKVKVGVLVLTMFDGETGPWLKKESLPLTVDVPGAYKPVRCSTDGLCVTQIGMGKSNAAASMTALLDSPKLDLGAAYFMTAGIAGTPPEKGTLGFAAWSRWVVDYDLGHHLRPEDVPNVPHGFMGLDMDTQVFHLNEKLAGTAYRLTKDLTLTDNQASVDERAEYPGQEGKKPFVALCDTVTGDNWFSGKEASAKAQYITDLHTGGKGEYCTTQMEDNATATALARRGYLDRYLDLRTASDFDQPHPGQSFEDVLSKFPGYLPSVDNAYLVGSTVAHYLIAHPGAE